MSVTHRIPDAEAGLTPCCGRSHEQLPRRDRISDNERAISCRGRDPIDPTLLPWAGWWERRCQARKEASGAYGGHHGRCELVVRHDGDHALERGLEIARWSTRSTWFDIEIRAAARELLAELDTGDYCRGDKFGTTEAAEHLRALLALRSGT